MPCGTGSQSTGGNKQTGTQREATKETELWNLLNSLAGFIFVSGFSSLVIGGCVYGVNLSNRPLKSREERHLYS